MKQYLFLLISISVFSQNINQFDANGQKDGIWRGKHTESQRIRYEGVFKNGIEQGTFKYFDDTKASDIVATRDFSENGVVAINKFFDQKKILVSEGKTINRKNEGAWRYYHKDSKSLKMIELYKDGLLNGKRQIFYFSNTLADETNFIAGMKNGLRKIFTEKGVVIEESYFKNNEFDGNCIFRNTMNQIVSQGNYSNGVKKGPWRFYENGKLLKTENFPIQKKFSKKNKDNKTINK